MKYLIVVLLLAVLLVSQTGGNKLWVHAENCTGVNDQACFFYAEDLETHTRCYAFRVMYHEGAAISCVKQ